MTSRKRMDNFGHSANFFPLLVGSCKTKHLEIKALKSFRPGHIKCTQMFLVVFVFFAQSQRRTNAQSKPPNLYPVPFISIMYLCLFWDRYSIKESGDNFCPNSRLSEKLYRRRRPDHPSGLQDVGQVWSSRLEERVRFGRQDPSVSRALNPFNWPGFRDDQHPDVSLNRTEGGLSSYSKNWGGRIRLGCLCHCEGNMGKICLTEFV